ncbi:MAG: D-alanine--D-alanine ligase [Rhodococcus sp. (in: high G+C Gram-positive bacteria)]
MTDRDAPHRSGMRVLALVGSAVDEFHADLSRVYAGGFFDALADEAEYRLRLAFVTPDGAWRFPESLDTASIATAQSMSAPDALTRITADGVDLMVPQMFCRPGMTTYRAAFDLLGIPYVGNTPEVMALAADKHLSRAVVASAGVAVPRGEVLRTAGATTTLQFPVVVKPVDSDNSMGVTLAHDDAALAQAVADALAFSDSALVEEYVELGREVRCGIIVRDGELVCLPLEEYAVDADKPIRSSTDKLDRSDGGDLYLVAKDTTKAWIVDVDDPITDRVWDAARRCHIALGCRHYSLFDFRIDPDGNPWFLEAGLYCSFSPSSVVAVMAAAAGVPVTDLFAGSVREVM